MSSFGGKADIAISERHVPFLTQSGHSCVNRHSPILDHKLRAIFMAEARVERRLAAILAADVASFSRLTCRDVRYS